MKNHNKVILDFTIINNPEQETAIMPASLAKKLLVDYSEKLIKATPRDIIEEFMLEIDKTETVIQAVNCAQEFVQERQLIENIRTKNWDAYKVSEMQVEAEVLVH